MRVSVFTRVLDGVQRLGWTGSSQAYPRPTNLYSPPPTHQQGLFSSWVSCIEKAGEGGGVEGQGGLMPVTSSSFAV